jgi:hypothetical protein
MVMALSYLATAYVMKNLDLVVVLELRGLKVLPGHHFAIELDENGFGALDPLQLEQPDEVPFASVDLLFFPVNGELHGCSTPL